MQVYLLHYIYLITVGVPGLGLWLSNQRCGRRGTKGYSLLPEREAQLQILVDEGKLVWDNNNIIEAWQNNYALLVAYGNEHGHCNVPQS